MGKSSPREKTGRNLELNAKPPVLFSIFAAGFREGSPGYFNYYLYMAGNRTFTMIKPDAVGAGNTGAIIKMIEDAGFRVLAIKKTQLTKERAGQFYAVHKERPFYNDLCAYMSSGPIVPMILEKANAVEDFRTLIGATDPKKAAPGTIRNLFAKSIEANAIHGSDSDENAAIESNFFFSELERF
jgi:nucleoside-diphosphate kinase